MKNEIIELRKKGKTYIEISNLLNCAKSTISYHCTKEGLGTSHVNKLSKEDIYDIKNLYINHINKKELSNKFGVSEYEIKKHINGLKRYSEFPEGLTRNQKQVISVSKRRKKIKELAIEYKGSKCQNCGYNKCKDALEFHHIDPLEKDFAIGSKGYTRSWDRVKKELDKCILVCANCHREIHHDLYKI